jgi:hypothetical protein
VTNEEMDDMVDSWHESDGSQTIYEYMGMTREEYGYWVETCIIPQSYLDRRSQVM